MDNEQLDKQLTAIIAVLYLHEALLAVLYADHVEFDKKLRDGVVEARESLLAFRNYTNHYLERLITASDPRAIEVSQAARERVSHFFRDVEAILLRRGKLDKPDPIL